MIIATYRIKCDACDNALKVTENLSQLKEILDSAGWEGDIYNVIHTCPECQKGVEEKCST